MQTLLPWLLVHALLSPLSGKCPIEHLLRMPMRYLAVKCHVSMPQNKVFLLAGEQAREWLVAIA